MSAHFNNLTPAQAESLALLAEECGEVIQAVCKILRHGLESESPVTGDSNQDALNKEAGDVMAAVDICREAWTLEAVAIEAAKQKKLARVEKYLHHASKPSFYHE